VGHRGPGMVAMEEWSTNEVKLALQRYVREGNSRDWDRALESAGGVSLLVALAEQMQHTGEPDLILIVRRLAREAGHRRADLLQSFRAGVVDASAEEGYPAALFQADGPDQGRSLQTRQARLP
jgi:hypothetical protein